MLEPMEEEIRTLHAILGSDRDPDGRAFAPLADAYRRAGQPRKAFGLLTDGLARLPDFASGHVIASRLYAEQGLFAESELAARRALELDPDNVLAMASLARVLESSGKTDEAAETRATLNLLEPEVLEEEGLEPEEPAEELAADEPEIDVADLAPEDAVMEMADLAPEEPVVDMADLAPEEPVMEMADLAPEEPVVDMADLAPEVGLAEPALEETVVDLSELAPEEPAVVLADGSIEEPVAAGATATAANLGSERNRSESGGGAAPRLYTRTLGELYARQGFVDRAVDVFRHLRAEHPDDAGLAERLGELEAQLSGGSSGSPSHAPNHAEKAPRAERARERDEELESLARDLAGQRKEEPSVDTPFAWTGSDEPENASEHAEEGPSIGSYFDDLLSWQPKGQA